ncbi:putative cytochrome P450 [Russula ochroleuca]|uniref:Cytochrome P450 n=1 Tax=Russula ochroleuca TaxID=152965 RepID=A0A9P5MMT3_9AGAM|nr:putative cytochrome P450 [Russula ochroleuca]
MDVHSLLPSFPQGILITVLGLLFYALVRVIYNVFFHPLSRFPGPRGAACTRWWLAYQEIGKGLHFSRPTVYNEIYNSQNKWDKDHEYYRAFDLDESFFTQTDYLKSKHSRALISNLFSRRAISEIQYLIRAQLDRFCDVLKEQNAAGDIVKGIDISMPTVTLAKFSSVFVWMIRHCPPSILMILAPSLKGVVVFRTALDAQVKSVLKNPGLLDNAPHRVMYSELLNPEANKGLPPPTALQLSHEARVLFAAGSHTVGTTLMTGVFYLLRNPGAKQRLVDEVRTAWPVLDEAPSYEELEKLPFLAKFALRMKQTAVIKESLRIGTPTPAGLPRVVPPSGAVISGVEIPEGTVVSQSPLFVSFSEEVFTRPYDFLPDRWLQPGSNALESWLVTFSKGPRSCLGINLAYCELYLTFAYLFRRFDVHEDLTK